MDNKYYIEKYINNNYKNMEQMSKDLELDFVNECVNKKFNSNQYPFNWINFNKLISSFYYILNKVEYLYIYSNKNICINLVWKNTYNLIIPKVYQHGYGIDIDKIEKLFFYFDYYSKPSKSISFEVTNALNYFNLQLNSLTEDLIIVEFRRQSLLLHPDKPTGSKDKFIELNKNKNILLEFLKRG